MATLITPRTRFLHIPKTGGTWVTLALQVAGVPCQIVWTRLGPGSRGHATLEQTTAYSDRFTFAFVRHPLDLYLSLIHILRLSLRRAGGRDPGSWTS